MSRVDSIRRMARYNAWMNGKVYDAAASLDPREAAADKGAFFKSILGTLNHLVVGDTYWMRALSAHSAAEPLVRAAARIPQARSLGDVLFEDLAELRRHRDMLDAGYLAFADALSEANLDELLPYPSGRYGRVDCRAFDLLTHVFNHQTHHRGQVTTLLSQAGRDVGSTDLLMLILADAAQAGPGASN